MIFPDFTSINNISYIIIMQFHWAIALYYLQVMIDDNLTMVFVPVIWAMISCFHLLSLHLKVEQFFNWGRTFLWSITWGTNDLNHPDGSSSFIWYQFLFNRTGALFSMAATCFKLDWNLDLQSVGEVAGAKVDWSLFEDILLILYDNIFIFMHFVDPCFNHRTECSFHTTFHISYECSVVELIHLGSIKDRNINTFWLNLLLFR